MITATFFVDDKRIDIYSSGSRYPALLVQDINTEFANNDVAARLVLEDDINGNGELEMSAYGAQQVNVSIIPNGIGKIGLFYREINRWSYDEDLNNIVGGAEINFAGGQYTMPSSFNSTGHIDNQVAIPITVPTEQGITLSHHLPIVSNMTLFGDSRLLARYGIYHATTDTLVKLAVVNGRFVEPINQGFVSKTVDGTLQAISSEYISTLSSGSDRIIFNAEAGQYYVIAVVLEPQNDLDPYIGTGVVTVEASLSNALELSNIGTLVPEQLTTLSRYDNYTFDYYTGEYSPRKAYYNLPASSEDRYFSIYGYNLLKSHFLYQLYDEEQGVDITLPLQSSVYDYSNNRFFIKIPAHKTLLLFVEREFEYNADIVFYAVTALDYFGYVRKVNRFSKSQYGYFRTESSRYFGRISEIWEPNGTQAIQFTVFDIPVPTRLKLEQVQDRVTAQPFGAHVYAYDTLVQFFENGTAKPLPLVGYEYYEGFTEVISQNKLPVGKYVIVHSFEYFSPQYDNGYIQTDVSMADVRTIELSIEETAEMLLVEFAVTGARLI